jgi:hypothetical protein
MAERVGFEPTCRLRDNTLSRRARYDHFGTSPQGGDRGEQKRQYTVTPPPEARGRYPLRRFRADSSLASTRRTSSNASGSASPFSCTCAFDTKRGLGFCLVCAVRATAAVVRLRGRFAIPPLYQAIVPVRLRADTTTAGGPARAHDDRADTRIGADTTIGRRPTGRCANRAVAGWRPQ